MTKIYITNIYNRKNKNLRQNVWKLFSVSPEMFTNKSHIIFKIENQKSWLNIFKNEADLQMVMKTKLILTKMFKYQCKIKIHVRRRYRRFRPKWVKK